MNSALPRALALFIAATLTTVPADAQVRRPVPVREVVRPIATPTTTTTTKTTPTPTETADPRKGRYRVVLAGGRVNNPTFDNPLNLDGWGDEVYFTADVQLLDKANGSISPFTTLSDRTKIYGDNGRDANRMRAGTAWMSGGLKAGDQFPAAGPFNQKGAFIDRQLPLRLWEGELIQGQTAVIITPMVWEYDGTAIADAVTGWMSFARDFNTKIAESKAIDALVAGTGSGIAGMVLDVAPLAPELILGVTSWLGRDGDRQIGARVEGDKIVYKPQPILLNYDRIEQFLNANVQVGNMPKGYYPIPFREPMSNKLEGDYTVYIYIQRMP